MRNKFQQTINEKITISGVGLHSGIHANMSLIPADENFGIRFKRIDLEGQPEIKAIVDNVVDTARGTTIANKEAKVSTIEHLMASLFALGIDNILIEIDAPEIPIMDGSAIQFVMSLNKVGIKIQNQEKIYYQLSSNLNYFDEERNVELMAIPSNDYSVKTLIDFNSPILGTQHAIFKKNSNFELEIASCRTFCFLHELEMLVKNNLIKGGDVNNAIVVVDRMISDDELKELSKLFDKDHIEVKSEGILNNVELHFSNEPARHKLLDVLGDLALVGFPFNANIVANRPGHAANIELAKLIREDIKANKNLQDIPKYDPNVPALYEVQDVEKILPHRYPFLLVDKIIELGEEHVIGVKNSTFGESHFLGHFPGNPVMPGVLQVEAMAQVGGILALSQFDDPHNYDTYFVKIDNCKFKKKVVPGDTLIIKMQLNNPIRRGMCDMHGKIYVGNTLCAEADMIAQIIKTRND